jgi:hypothetical protein
VLGIYIPEEKNMIIAQKFIRSLVEKYGKHTVYTDGGTVSRHMSNKWIEVLSTFINRKESDRKS